jgi:putative membrane protein
MPDDARHEQEPDAPERPRTEALPVTAPQDGEQPTAGPAVTDTVVAMPAEDVLGQRPEGPSDDSADDPHERPRALPAELAALNEAVPAQPPQEGRSSIGTIPQTNAARLWARAQATNWRLYLVRFVCAGLAVVVTVALIPGLRFEQWRWGQFTQIAVVFGLLNMTIKPILQFLTLRFIFNTYGLVVIVINTLLLVVLGLILPDLVNAARPTAVLAGGLLVGVLGLVFETTLGANPPVLDRNYRERNGLA